jgi:thioesterase domain-containing protein
MSRRGGISRCIRLRQSKDAQGTVFCFPGAGASISCFMPFANALGSAVHITGVQPAGLDSGDSPHESVEEAARNCVGEIQDIGKGPFKLIGHSFGGWVAIEVANLLLQHNCHVMPVVILDSAPPSDRFDANRGRQSRGDVLRKYVRVLVQAAGMGNEVESQLAAKLGSSLQIEDFARLLKAAGLIPPSLAASLLARLVRAFEVHINTLYCPREFPVDVYLLQAQEVDEADEDYISAEDSFQRWQQFAPNVKSILVTGNHMTMLSVPNIDFVAGVARKVWMVDAFGD